MQSVKQEKKREEGVGAGSRRQSWLHRLNKLKTRVLNAALLEEALGSHGAARALFRQAGLLEAKMATRLDQEGRPIAVDHWISAASCALKGGDFPHAREWAAGALGRAGLRRSDTALLRALLTQAAAFQGAGLATTAAEDCE